MWTFTFKFSVHDGIVLTLSSTDDNRFERGFKQHTVDTAHKEEKIHLFEGTTMLVACAATSPKKGLLR